MAQGKGKEPKDMRLASSWQNWCINFSFFFITGCQAVLWPWCPVILRAAGLTYMGAGVALTLIILGSMFGVHIALWVIKKTRNGAVRRLFLLGMFVCSIFFSISSVLILPTVYEAYFCSPNFKRASSEGEQLTRRGSSNWKTEQSSNFEKHNSNYEAITRPIELPPNLFDESRAPYGPSHSFKESERYTTTTTTQVSTSAKAIAPSASSIDGMINRVTKEQIPKNPSILRPPNVQPFLHAKKAPYEDVEMESMNSPSSAKNNSVNIKKENGLSKISEIYQDTFINNRQISEPTSLPVNYFATEINNMTVAPISAVMISTTVAKQQVSHRSSSAIVDGKRNINKYDMDFVPNIPSETASDISPHQDLFEINTRNYRTSYSSNNKKESNGDNQFIRSHGTIQGENRFDPYFKPRPILSVKDSAIEYLPLTFRKDPDQREPVPLQARRTKRNIPDARYSIDRSVIAKTSEIINQNFVRKINPNGDDEQRHQTNFGAGVASLLVIAILIGGGVEAAISKIWFVTKYGPSQDSDGIEALEIIIGPIFQVCAMGEHRYWSLVTSSLWITLPTIFVGLLCQMGASMYNPLTVMGVFHGLAGIMGSFTLLFIPMPYGSMRRCSARRPLSLYLDDEVIREGLRRVAFHLWVLVNGLLAALPTYFTLWLLQESSVTKGEIFVAQVISIIALFLGEATAYPAGNWLSRKLNTQGVMIMASSMIWVQCILAYLAPSLWVRSGSLLLVGQSATTTWTAIRNNAFLLGTSRDQEQEAWASWICWKVGSAFGCTIWASLVEWQKTGSVSALLLPAAIIGMVVTAILIVVTLLTKTRKQSRRRIYHTLDLNNFSEDDDEEITSPEDDADDDWLVKRAKKEGLIL